MECSNNLYDKIKEQLEYIKNASDEAKKQLDYDKAHLPLILTSIKVVEKFLKTTKRICYGGQAINAHLPEDKKIYDKDYNVPDYDFYSPDNEKDAQLLKKMLINEGLPDIEIREGVHEGTTKVYSSFISVADITKMDQEIYDTLFKRKIVRNGISYMDANILRMNMYIELSRPKGEVERWPKVYERLLLFNKYVPITPCYKKNMKLSKGNLSKEEVKMVMDYMIQENRIFAGADLVGLYRNYVEGKKKADWILRTRLPIFVLSADVSLDTAYFLYEFGKNSSSKVYSENIVLQGDITPEIKIIKRDYTPILVIIGHKICNAYYTIPVQDNKSLRIATLDTLIYIYFNLFLLKNRLIELSPLECLAQELIDISCRARSDPSQFPFPFISLQCEGYQSSIKTLLRKKKERVKERRRTQKLHKLKKRIH